MTALQAQTIGGACFPERESPAYYEEERPFGYNWTEPTSPLSHSFTWHSARRMGAPPVLSSASSASFRDYPGSGYPSFVIPFFSEAYLSPQYGQSSDVIDFRLSRAVRGNDRQPNYFCVRLSWDGHFIHQLCDPNDDANRTTGVVRGAILEFWNDLKRAHFIDASTKFVMVTIPLSANHLGVRELVNIMFEFCSSGTVLPSYESLARVDRLDKLAWTEIYLWIAFGLTCFFCLMELSEILGLEVSK